MTKLEPAGVQTPAPNCPDPSASPRSSSWSSPPPRPSPWWEGRASEVLLGNGVGFPTLFATSAVILVLFSVGLSAMAKHVAKPGAFFTYVGYGLAAPRARGRVGRHADLHDRADRGVRLHRLSALLHRRRDRRPDDRLVGDVDARHRGCRRILGYRHIDVSSKVLGLLIAEVGIVVALIVAVIVTGGAQGLSAAPFEPPNVLSGSPGVGLMFAMAAYIGFEATAVFRDEARDPDKTIPKATYAAVIGVGVFYTLASWALVMAWGPDGVVDAAAEARAR
jgi:hypothetical protein